MTDFNYSNLSPYDFELLTRDLLQKSEGLRLRAFAPGRDGGIDLRAWKSEQRRAAVIVQCKHMSGSTFANLRASIRKERIKLDKLKARYRPARYILATTQALTADNVDELYGLLTPYCLTTEDIIDVMAIEGLLSQYDSVLRKHYKLWVTGTSVLERILHAGIYNRSESYKQKLIDRSKIFVQTNALERARRTLRERHNLIISGPPGVGKTTLADMLCLEHLAQDFELIAISEDVSEADELYSRDTMQIFVYDDFLGRTDVTERLGKNEDARLLDFIHRVEVTPNHRFILTTREYLLRSARNRYERLDSSDIDILKYILEMQSYSQVQKGLILYEHLAFANFIEPTELEDFISHRSYRQVIAHRNYTPRHITDALAEIRRSRSTGDGSSLEDLLLTALNDPTRLWTHALRQLTADARLLFLTLVLLPDSVQSSDLQSAFTASVPQGSETFLDVLRSLEDSFLAIDRGTSGTSVVSFRNPSLQDFARAYVDYHSDWLDRLLNNPVFFEQISGLFGLALAQTAPASSRTTRRSEIAQAKFGNIFSWVQKRKRDLLTAAARLASTESLTGGRKEQIAVIRLSQLIEVALAFNLGIDASAVDAVRCLVGQATDPPNRTSADALLDLLAADRAREVLDEVVGSSVLLGLRAKLLQDEAPWRYTTLRRIDEVTNLRAESMEAWGQDYVTYARNLTDTLVDGFDEYQLEEAIREFREMAEFLGVDFDRQIGHLAQRRETLMAENNHDDYDDENVDIAYSDSGDDVHLDRIFGSLLPVDSDTFMTEYTNGSD